MIFKKEVLNPVMEHLGEELELVDGLVISLKGICIAEIPLDQVYNPRSLANFLSHKPGNALMIKGFSS